MTLLLTYLLLALMISFLCSLLESVLLSVPRSHIAVLVERGSRAGARLKRMKDDVDRPLAAILTVNTFAHTLGAAGVGAQAVALWGEAWVGAISVLVTLLILVFSEIIPKSLGAVHAKNLSPFAAWAVHGMILVLWPIVAGCSWVASVFSRDRRATGKVSRAEVRSLAQIALEEGSVAHDEAAVIHNLIALREITVEQVMTPRPVVFTLRADQTVEEVTRREHPRCTRIPVLARACEDVKGLVHRHQLFRALSDGRGHIRLGELVRPLHVVPELANLSAVLKQFIERCEHLFLVVDEFGSYVGIVTLEDVIETLLGVEIMDETDSIADMQAMARKLARERRAKARERAEED